jgi:hypothetical protein
LAKLIFGGDVSDTYDLDKQEYNKHKPAVLEVGMTEADLSNRGLGVGGAIIVSTWISHKDKGALTSLDISSNDIVSATWMDNVHQKYFEDFGVYSNYDPPRKDLKKVGDLVDGNPISGIDENDGRVYVVNLNGIRAVANAIKDMGALLVLSLKGNGIYADGCKALAEGLKGNRVITELNIADSILTSGGTDMSGIVALADAISDMGALLKFDISNNSLYATGTKALAEGLKGNQRMTKLNMSSNDMGVSYKHGPSDMSGLITLADVIPGMGALLVLSLKGNGLGTEEGGKVVCEMLKDNSVLQELDLSSNNVWLGDQAENWSHEIAPKFAKALSQGLASNRAISTVILHKFPLPIQEIKAKAKLDLSSKGLGVFDAIVIAALLPLNVSGTIFMYPCCH